MLQAFAIAAVAAAPATTLVMRTTRVATEARSGLPQFEFGVWPGQIFWLLVTFAVVYSVLARVLLPRVRMTLQARDARIEADMAAARDLREEAFAQQRGAEAWIAAARASGQRAAAEAKSRAQAEAARRNAALEAELDVRLTAAEARIAQARALAMGQIRGVASEIASTITVKLTGRSATLDELETGLTAASHAR